MKLISRPREQAVGEGPYAMKFSLEELELIASMVYITRMGPSTYSDAALSILDKLDEMFDPDFVAEAAALVDLSVAVVDDHDNIIDMFHHSTVSLEV